MQISKGALPRVIVPDDSQMLNNLKLWSEMLRPGSSFPSSPNYAGGSKVKVWVGAVRRGCFKTAKRETWV